MNKNRKRRTRILAGPTKKNSAARRNAKSGKEDDAAGYPKKAYGSESEITCPTGLLFSCGMC